MQIDGLARFSFSAGSGGFYPVPCFLPGDGACRFNAASVQAVSCLQHAEDRERCSYVAKPGHHDKIVHETGARRYSLKQSMDPEKSRAFANFAVKVRSDSVRDGLALLLKRTDYRFIGIWRFENGKANAVVHYDRENPEVLTATEVPDTATYCCYVRESGQPFMTPNALVDARLGSHPAREQVLSYCGVPVMDSFGNILGTLCHYDLVPRDVAQVDIELMLSVASFLALGGHVPPYPSDAGAAS
jgi:GAF domain-containing protein